MSYLPDPPQRSNPATFAALADPFLAALPGFGDVMETLALAATEGSFQGTYAGGATYAKGETVVSGGVFYVSMQNANTGNTPASSPAWWYSPLSAFLTASAIISAAQGGTGITSYTAGDLVYASDATTLARLADVATGNALISGGVGVAPAWGKIGLTTHVTGTLAAGNGGTGVTTSTGSGSNVLSISPALVTPNLGTPTSGTLTNCTGLPLTSGVTGTLPVANGGTGVTTSTGSGSNVLSTSPTLVAPALGTPSSGVLTSCTGLPLTSGVTGTLGVANGGTGQTTYTNGQLLIGNTTGNTLTKATLTQGAGITITNGTGSITIAANNTLVESGTNIQLGANAGGSGSTNRVVSVGYNAGNNVSQNTIFLGAEVGTALGGTSANAVLVGTYVATSVTANVSNFIAIGSNILNVAGATVGNNNVLIGASVCNGASLGADNTVVGSGAGTSATGASNSLFGSGAGSTYTTGASNTVIGPYSGTSASTSGEVAIATGAGTRRFWHDGTGAFVSHTTTASAANAFLDSGTSALLRSTSSLRYKRDVEPLWPDESAKLLKLKPVFYRSKCDADPEAWSYYGVIAEEADKLGLQRLVQYEYAPEDYGEPDDNNERWPKPDAKKVPGGFAYDRMTVLLLDLVQRQDARIAALEEKLKAIEA